MMYRDECFRNISREPPMTGELISILPQVMAGVAVTVMHKFSRGLSQTLSTAMMKVHSAVKGCMLENTAETSD